MGVTAIKSISNRAEIPYHVRNRENPGDTGGDGEYLAIYPGEDRSVNMWVPWCDNATDYAHDKNILFEAIGSSDQPDQAGESFSVWQSGDYIYCSTEDRFDSGGLVSGNATVNGDRSVEITGSEIRFY